MRNRDLALGFLRTVAEGQIKKAFEHFVAPTFIHHNQYFKGDRESLLLAMEESERLNPTKIISVKQVIEDKNIVVTHSHVKMNPQDRGMVVVHIFRIDNEKICELWDIIQPIGEKLPNENGVF